MLTMKDPKVERTKAIVEKAKQYKEISKYNQFWRLRGTKPFEFDLRSKAYINAKLKWYPNLRDSIVVAFVDTYEVGRDLSEIYESYILTNRGKLLMYSKVIYG